MFETLAPYIIAGLVVVLGYAVTQWVANIGHARQWEGAAVIGYRHNDELSEQIAGMQAEGCRAMGALENIFNGVTAGGMPHSKLVRKVADVATDALLLCAPCEHKAQAEEMMAAKLNAENWQNLAVESEARAEEAERLLGLANDRLAAERE